MIYFETNRLFEGNAAVYSFSSEKTNYPAANVKNYTKALVWRTAGVSGEAITFSGLSGKISRFGLFNTNLQNGAAVTLELANDAAFTQDLLTFNFTGTQIKAGLQSLGGEYSRAFARLEITDDGNPDGYIQVGLAWLGYPALSGYIKAIKPGLLTKDQINLTKEMIAFELRRPALTAIDLTINLFSEADYQAFKNLISVYRAGRPFRVEFTNVIPVAGLILDLARFSEPPEINYTGRLRWESQFKLIEVL